MWKNSDEEDSPQYRLRQAEESSQLDKPDNDRGDGQGKSRASIISLVIGVAMIVAGIMAFDEVDSLGSQNPIAGFVFWFVAVPLLALGAISIFFSAFFKTMSSLSTPEEKDQQADSNDETVTENAQSTTRGGRRLVKWFFVIVQLGVLAFFIKFFIAVDFPILASISAIAAGALIWRLLLWERNERMVSEQYPVRNDERSR